MGRTWGRVGGSQSLRNCVIKWNKKEERNFWMPGLTPQSSGNSCLRFPLSNYMDHTFLLFWISWKFCSNLDTLGDILQQLWILISTPVPLAFWAGDTVTFAFHVIVLVIYLYCYTELLFLQCITLMSLTHFPCFYLFIWLFRDHFQLV